MIYIRQLSLNDNSLSLHLDEVETILKEKVIHFLVLNETKIDETYEGESLQTEGFKLLWNDRNRKEDTFQIH